MEIPSVCIIIPTYNRAEKVCRTIDSVLSQNYQNLQILIVDDGSTDGTIDALQQYRRSPNVKIVRHKNNRGVTAAKNTGINNLDPLTKYFGILDSDDTLVKDAIGSLVEKFEELGDSVSQVFGWCIDPTNGESTGHYLHKEGFVSYEDALCGKFRGEFWQIVRRNLLGELRFDERAKGGESVVWHSMMKCAPGYLVSKVVRYYDRSGEDRVSKLSFDPVSSTGRMWNVLSYLTRFENDLKTKYPERYGNLALNAANWALLANMRPLAIRLILESVPYASTKRVLKSILQFLLPVRFLVYVRNKKYRF